MKAVEKTVESEQGSARVLLTPPRHRIEGEILLSGSKSYTNRALILAALADGRSELINASSSDDSKVMLSALSKLGVSFGWRDETLWVQGCGGRFKPYQGDIDLGPAGTCMRFLTALCAFVEGVDVVLRGSKRMHTRPIADLVEGLKSLGAQIEYVGSFGCPPLRILGRSAPSLGRVSLSGAASSQFFSALLMVSPFFKEGLEIEVLGEQVSKSYIDMTVASMRAFGVEAQNQGYCRYAVPAGARYQSRVQVIEPDASGASYLWGIAAISRGRVKVKNLSFGSAQGDIAFPKFLERMGCRVSCSAASEPAWIEVEGPARLIALEADMSSCPDTAQSLAVVAAMAEGESRIHGLSTLKHKETDRLVALQQELARVGITSRVTESEIYVQGGDPHAASIKTYDDHRMAMSFAMLGSKLDGLAIESPAVVTKSFPDFWEQLSRLGIGVRCE
ncbi:MAG: 3-phosphoshikimate 1-carboxyvinyltransferase [Deltaproteobacteria bacterium]|nr:3-phosphoshikimate 1-carboxyvinyltransferase [Deltaproteobacteria bacterium]